MTVRKQTKRRRCHYCGTGDRKMTRDHIVPKGRGGQNAPWNYVDACEVCNHFKADKWPWCECIVCLTSVDIHALFGVVYDANYKAPSRVRVVHNGGPSELSPELDVLREDVAVRL